MNDSKLILVLGDQLSTQQPALRAAVPGRDIILMAEVAEEASYVRHNRHKIALLFSAMRHFKHELESLGFRVEYVPFEAGTPSLEAAVSQVLDANDRVGSDDLRAGRVSVSSSR
jgi:deoxyribodipyrimidine photolyase-related protein